VFDKDAYKDVVFGVYSKNDISLNDKVIIPADGLVGTLTIDEDVFHYKDPLKLLQ